LLGDDEDEDEEEEEEDSAPAAVTVDYAAAEVAAASNKKKSSTADNDLAKLMGDMEGVDAKRQEQAAKERARKAAQKKKK